MDQFRATGWVEGFSFGVSTSALFSVLSKSSLGDVIALAVDDHGRVSVRFNSGPISSFFELAPQALPDIIAAPPAESEIVRLALPRDLVVKCLQNDRDVNDTFLIKVARSVVMLKFEGHLSRGITQIQFPHALTDGVIEKEIELAGAFDLAVAFDQATSDLAWVLFENVTRVSFFRDDAALFQVYF